MLAGARVLPFAEGEVIAAANTVPQAMGFITDGAVQTFVIAEDGRRIPLSELGPGDYIGGTALTRQRMVSGTVALVALPRFPEPDSIVDKGSLLAPMPGSVIRLGAGLGDTVAAGQPLVWLEAMKMEHTITAPADGVLTQLSVSVGQQVDVGAVLARVEAVGGTAETAQLKEGS